MKRKRRNLKKTHKSLGKNFPRRGIKCRAYLDGNQTNKFCRDSGCNRFVYNEILKRHNVAYDIKIDAENEAEFLAECDLQFRGVPVPEHFVIDEKIEHDAQISDARFNEILQELKEEYLWLRECNQKVLYGSVRTLLAAFSNFFKNSSRFGYPKRKKKKKSTQSCHFNSQCFSGIQGNRVNLTGDYSDIRFDCSKRDMRYLNRYQDYIQETVVSRTKSGRFHIAFSIGDFEHNPLFDRDNVPFQVYTCSEKLKSESGYIEEYTDDDSVVGCYLMITDKETGEVKYKKINAYDFGLIDKAIGSDGSRYSNNKYAKKYKQRLARLQRSLNKKKFKSKKYDNLKDFEIPKNSPDAGRNREKARKKVARCSEKIANARHTNNHQITSDIVSKSDIIALEDLAIENMMKNHRLAGAIQDAGWGEMNTQIEQKATRYGRIVIRVGRFYPSSRICPHCGQKHEDLSLKDRAWVCPHCGHVVDDRDVNAAENILTEAIRLYRESLGESHSVAVIKFKRKKIQSGVESALLKPAGERCGSSFCEPGSPVCQDATINCNKNSTGQETLKESLQDSHAYELRNIL